MVAVWLPRFSRCISAADGGHRHPLSGMWCVVYHTRSIPAMEPIDRIGAPGVVSLVQCRVGATGRSPLWRPGCTRRPACPVTPPTNPTCGYRNGYIRYWTSDKTPANLHPLSSARLGVHVLPSAQIRRRVTPMRTTIDIDDDLLEKAMRATGAKTKREVVELGLATLVRLKEQEEIRGFRGKAAVDARFGRNETGRMIPANSGIWNSTTTPSTVSGSTMPPGACCGRTTPRSSRASCIARSSPPTNASLPRASCPSYWKTRCSRFANASARTRSRDPRSTT